VRRLAMEIPLRERFRRSRMIGRLIVGATLCVVSQSRPADAQLRRRAVVKAPPNWIGGGITVMQGFTLLDGTTSSQWRFDSGLGYTASFEHPTQAGLMLGVQGTYATPTMIFSQTGTPSVQSACPTSCDGTGTITQIMALIHSGNGYSFHPVYQLTLGATGFSNFRDRSGNKMGPATTDYDFSFALGYGLGFGLSGNVGIEVVQEIGTVLHQRDGLAAGSSNFPRISATRLGGKIAF
jgi:hypothetical protein